MITLPWADRFPAAVVAELQRAREENDPEDIYDLLAYYLDIISPNEMIQDGFHDLAVEFPSAWMFQVFWDYWKDGNPGWDKGIKTALVSSIVHSPDYHSGNMSFNPWKQIVEMLSVSSPRINSEDVESYYKKNPDFVQIHLD